MANTLFWWAKPTVGEIVWCYFPYGVQHLEPAPKPRPVLIISVFDDNAPHYGVRVVYGTSKNVNTLQAGDFLISNQNLPAYQLAGLSYNTKFCFSSMTNLPYNDTWFKVPPNPSYGQTPKLGVLHPSLMQAVGAAYRAVTTAS